MKINQKIAFEKRLVSLVVGGPQENFRKHLIKNQIMFWGSINYVAFRKS